MTSIFCRGRATVQGQRWLRRLTRREGPQTDKTEQPMLALRGWVKIFFTLGCLSFSILLSFHPFLMCPYPIRWFPVPSVIEPSPRSPTLRGTCQCTRRLIGVWVHFLFLVQDNGEAVLLRRLWMEIPPPSQHAKALGHPQNPGQGALKAAKLIISHQTFPLTPHFLLVLYIILIFILTQAKSKASEEEKASKKEKLEEAKE